MFSDKGKIFGWKWELVKERKAGGKTLLDDFSPNDYKGQMEIQRSQHWENKFI